MSDPALGRVLGSGKAAEVFEFGTAVIKLYRSGVPKRSAFREAAVLALVEMLGLPVPQAIGVRQVGARWGVIMTRAEGPSFADVMRAQPERVPDYLKAMARLHSRVHGHPGTELGSLKARLASNIKQATKLGEARQTVLLEQLGTMPEGEHLCHGDFHPLNILGPPGSEIVVDWPDATRGDPAADVCRSFVLIRPVAPEVAGAYVEAYASGGETREKVYRWVPFIAAARIAEGVPDEEEGLMEMAGSRWRA
jgi:aminoglycoside phosphotransferase (APT) family kinase protein